MTINGTTIMVLIRKEFQTLTKDLSDLIQEFNIELDGDYCLICKLMFPDNPEKWTIIPDDPKRSRSDHHLNGNKNDNRPINHCIAHKVCNETERWNTDFEIISHEILNRNFKLLKDGRYDDINQRIRELHIEKEREINSRTHPEMVSNKLYLELAQKEMSEKCKAFGEYPYKSIVQNVAFRHFKDSGGVEQGGGASLQGARNAVDILCSDLGEFEIFKIKTTRYIRKREV